MTHPSAGHHRQRRLLRVPALKCPKKGGWIQSQQRFLGHFALATPAPLRLGATLSQPRKNASRPASQRAK